MTKASLLKYLKNKNKSRCIEKFCKGKNKHKGNKIGNTANKLQSSASSTLTPGNAFFNNNNNTDISINHTFSNTPNHHNYN